MASLIDRCLGKTRSKMFQEEKALEIQNNIEKIQCLDLSKATKTLGPSPVTKIFANDSSIKYSTTNGNICTYSIETLKVLDFMYFPFPIQNFIIHDNLLAISSQTEFRIYSYPELNLLISENMVINTIGDKIITGGNDGNLRIWDSTGNKILFTNESSIFKIIVKDQLVLMLSLNLVLFDLGSLEVLYRNDKKDIKTVELSDKFIVEGSLKGIFIINLSDFSHFLSFSSKIPVSCLSLSDNSEFLAAGYVNGVIKVYDLQNKRTEIALQGHTSEVLQIIIVKFDFIISCSKDQSVKIRTFPEFPNETIYSTPSTIVKVYLLGSSVICCRNDKRVGMFKDEYREIFSTKGVSSSIEVINDILIIGDDLGMIYLINYKINEPIFEMQAHNGAIRGLVVTDDYLITGGADSNIFI